MKYQKAGWTKYSNRLLPKRHDEHWLVEINSKYSEAFFNRENAVIFEKLLEIERKLKGKNDN